MIKKPSKTSNGSSSAVHQQHNGDHQQTLEEQQQQVQVAENGHPQNGEEKKHDFSPRAPSSLHRNEDDAAGSDKSPVNELKQQKQAPKEDRKFDDSDSDLSSGSDPTTKHNILRSTSLRKAYKNLKQQEKEEFDLVQSDASQSESEAGNIPSHRNVVTPHVPGKSLLKTPKVMIQKQETISQKDRLVCITRPSILSRDSGNQLSYKGFLNLAIIILVVSHLRLVLINFKKYGILLNTHVYIMNFLSAPSNGFPVVVMFAAVNIWILLAFGIEKVIAIYIRNKFYHLTRKGEMTSKKKALWQQILKQASLVSFCCYFVLTTTLLGVYLSFVWFYQPHSVSGMMLVTLMTIVFLKLTSYGVVNDHLRERIWERKAQQLKTVENTSTPSSNRTIPWFKQYPDNISLKDIFYFMLAPTLVYEEAFPRTKSIRFKVVLYDLLELLACTFVLVFLVEQYVMPLIENSLEPMREREYWRILERLLKLTVPNIVIWVIGFYIVFHLSLNIMAELLKFGDRLFYLDWWNCTDLSYFWRTWNLPVHKWLVLHIYLPLVNNGFSPSIASFCVFFVSAVFHELIISIPFHTVKAWAFSAMMVQMPLCFLTKKYCKGSQIGNALFWCSFMIGHSNCVLALYYDMK
ncbi:hypothetical protein C9374_005804 [Naegleria lovaniensis]|uniref:O-acyltransferase n=1 Tax=Naegleria lovaniensis TaxID=51637 RepID=A0AA88GPI3_NAELO|nr:uncharacterized protein C9374_005804 [Naegleria lovaniensis]KAG2382012.1 hypothetical protein C9374_005804 [Naegleria lovaniensis]